MTKAPIPPKVLTIAGSDSGGSAGIQADLKTLTACGIFGASAITTVTAQNTMGVMAVFALPPDFVRAQIQAVLDDIGADVIKTGLLGRPEIITLVADMLPNVPLVVDPVLVNGHGQQIVSDEAIRAYQTHLFPRATIITPNIDEAKLLTGMTKLDTRDDFEVAAHQLFALGPKNVLIKGGQLPDRHQVFDVLYDGDTLQIWEQPKLPIDNPHGIGCTFASAIAAELSKGHAIHEAVSIAIGYVHMALAGAINWQIGHGRSPVNHFVATKRDL